MDRLNKKEVFNVIDWRTVQSELNKALDIYKTVTQLAQMVGIAPSYMRMFYSRSRKMPLHYAMKLEDCTKGVIQSRFLRPDLKFVEKFKYIA